MRVRKSPARDAGWLTASVEPSTLLKYMHPAALFEILLASPRDLCEIFANLAVKGFDLSLRSAAEARRAAVVHPRSLWVILFYLAWIPSHSPASSWISSPSPATKPQ